jgi:transcriptional antiterminator RfaH
LRVKRVTRAHKVSLRAEPLFRGYTFVLIEMQWHAIQWQPGVLGLILDGDRPAKVPDKVIAELHARERNGLVELPSPSGFRRGDRVKIIRGPLIGLSGLVEGLRPQQRIEILLAVLGRVGLPRSDVEAVE